MRITEEHLNTIFKIIDGHPATQINSRLTLPMTAEDFKVRFNAELIPTLRKIQLDDEQRATIKKLFLIDRWQIFTVDNGKIFFNVFGDSVTVFNVTGKTDDRVKFLLCAFTVPETSNDTMHASLIVAALVKVFLPTQNVEKFLKDLTAVSNMIVGRMEFSLVRINDLMLIMAAREGTL